MSTPSATRTRRSGRRIVLAGALWLAAVYVAGAAVVVPAVHDDLAARVERRLADNGLVVDASFSGQDGTLRCGIPLPDPDRAEALAAAVWGVREVRLDAACRAGDGVPPTESSTTIAPAITEPATTIAPTTQAPTTSATTVPATTAPATTTTVATAPQLAAQLVDGRILLAGTVSSDLEHLAIVDRARNAVGGANVVDSVAVDAAVPPVPGAAYTGMLDVLAAMPVDLVGGVLTWDGTAVAVTGTYADDAHRAALEAVTAQAGVAVQLTPRATATAEQAVALEAELNALVAAEPILFDKGSTTVSLASFATVQKVAGIAKRYAGLTIEVQGHTDSEGDPGRNLTLSEQRAGSVRDFLVALGVPATDLSAKGFGMTQLILDANGNEIPESSRRVVFAVTVLTA